MADVLPTDRRTDWEANTRTGVPGGIPTNRTNIVDVTASPYFAAANSTETTGTISNGSPTLTVGSATDFSVGNYVKVALPSIQTMTVTAGASATGYFRLYYTTAFGSYVLVLATSGQTATQVATTIRATAVPGWSLSGSGTSVVFTQTWVSTGFTISTGSDPSASTGVTSSVVEDQAAVVACTSNRIDTIVGTTFTLHDNAAAAVTGGIVSHNDTPSVQAAFDASSAQDIVYLPAGVYQFETVVSLSYALDNRTIRGAGPTSTIIHAHSRAFLYVGDGWTWPSPAATISSGLTKDATSITLDDASQFSSGALMLIAFEDQIDNTAIQAGAALTFGVGGSDPARGLRSQVTRVTGKVSNTLTIEPGIYRPADANVDSAHCWVAQLQCDFVGIEDLAIDMNVSEATSAIQMNHGYGCWIKNVKVSNVKNYCIEVVDSLQCEVNHCELRDRRIVIGSNGAGLLSNTNSGNLYVNNIIYNSFPGLEQNAGTSGTAFVYNLVENPPDIVYGIVGFGMTTNHGPHNSMNIFEGNISPSAISDGYFGSESECSLIRNWLTATWEDGTVITFSCSPHRFSRNFTFAGNTMGTTAVSAGDISYGYPNIGNASYTGTAEPTAGDFWADWDATATLSTRVSDTAGTITLDSGTIATGQYFTIRWGGGSNYQSATAGTVSGSDVPWTGGSGTALPAASTAVQVYMQPLGYQELDLDVENSTIEKGNAIYTAAGASYSVTSLGGDTVSDSYVYNSKPAFFGNLTWPYDPTANPDALSYEDTPAGYRFINGTDPPSGNAVSTGISGLAKISGKVTIQQ